MVKLLKSLYVTVVFTFLYAPLLITVFFSFNDSRYSVVWHGFTLKWYQKMAENTGLWNAAANSLLLAAAAATAATVIGTITAVALHRYRFIGQKVIYGSLSVLMMSPEIIMAISLIMMFVILSVPLGFTTLLLSHTLLCFPYVAMTVLARMKGVNRHLVEAASDLGAGEVDIVRYVLIPLMMPAILAGWLMSFTLSLDDVIISFFVSGPGYEILPLKIYSMVRTGVKPDINALCAVLFFVTFFVVMLAYRLVTRKKV